MTSFLGGLEYSHGGISAQECRIPEIHVRNNYQRVKNPRSKCAGCVGLTCAAASRWKENSAGFRSGHSAASGGCQFSSVVDATRAADANGVASLALVRDEMLGASASIVLFGEDGTIIQRVVSDSRRRHPMSIDLDHLDHLTARRPLRASLSAKTSSANTKANIRCRPTWSSFS